MTHLLLAFALLPWLSTYGYGTVLLVVAQIRMGIPAPGETVLLAATITAGTTRALSLPLVIGAAAGGAVPGDNLGYWIGTTGGARLLLRYGSLVRINERKLKLGLVLFQQYRGKVVFFGRFVPVLRLWAAWLAGIYNLRWTRFLWCNALGGLLWATSYGLGGSLLGTTVYRLTGPPGWGLILRTGGVMVAVFFLLSPRTRVWEEHADGVFPGPLEHYIGPGDHRQAAHRRSTGAEKQTIQDGAGGLSSQHVQAASPGTSRSTHGPGHSPQNRERYPPTGPARKPLRPIHLERWSSLLRRARV